MESMEMKKILELVPPSATEGEEVKATVQEAIFSDKASVRITVGGLKADVTGASGNTVTFEVPKTPRISPRKGHGHHHDKDEDEDEGGIGGIYEVVIKDKGEEFSGILVVLGSGIHYIKGKRDDDGQQIFLFLTLPTANESQIRERIEKATNSKKDDINIEKLTPSDSKKLGGLADADLSEVRVKGSRRTIGTNLDNLRREFELTYEFSLKGDQKSGYDKAMEKMEKGAPVWAIAPEVIDRGSSHSNYHPGPVDDPRSFDVNDMNGLNAISLAPAVPAGSVTNVVVAVLDSAGIDTASGVVVDHFEVKSTEIGPIPTGVTLPPNPILVKEHGLAIGKAIDTIIPGVRIIYKMVFERKSPSNYVCKERTVYNAIKDVLTEVQVTGESVVFNLSFGSFEYVGDGILPLWLRIASARGALIAAAAGNWENIRPKALQEAKDDHEADRLAAGMPPANIAAEWSGYAAIAGGIARVYPAAFGVFPSTPLNPNPIPGLVGVGALQHRKAPGQWERADWSMRGDWVSVAAYGRKLKLKGREYQGTSFSTPIVAAALALLRSHSPAATTNAQIVQCLMNQARTNRAILGLPALTPPNLRDDEFGAGPVIPNAMSFVCP